MECSGGNRRERWRPRAAALAAGIAAIAVALSIAACGEGSNSNEAEGRYEVKVVKAEFPTEQRLGQTSLMRLDIRNTGRKTVPALIVYVTIAGRAGENSFLPFGYRDPQPGLAQPDRPIWALAARYPQADGTTLSAGGEGSNRKTFDFGPLKPGKTLQAIWKLSAVKAGKHTIAYEIDAGLGGKAKAESNGAEAGGSFTAQISTEPPNTEVTDSGEVVEIETGKGK